MESPDSGKPRKSRRWALILWPAFLAACLLQVLIFSMIDPTEVQWPSLFLQPSRQGVYTVAFFSFWLISMVCSSLVLWLAEPAKSS